MPLPFRPPPDSPPRWGGICLSEKRYVPRWRHSSFIISDHAEKIAGRLLEELDIGVTYVQGSGAYSGKEKSVIMCAMKKNISPKAEEIVKEEDPLAFMIVTSATEIFGEGYKSYFSEKL